MARVAESNITVVTPAAAPGSIVKAQARISPSGIVTKSPVSTTPTRPGVGSPAVTDFPLLTAGFFVQPSKLSTAGSNRKTSGASVTSSGPFFIREIGTITCVPGAPLAPPIMICGGSGVFVAVAVGVAVAAGVNVRVAVGGGVFVAVAVGVRVRVAVGVRVRVAVGGRVLVAVLVGTRVKVGRRVGVFRGDGVTVGGTVGGGVPVGFGVGRAPASSILR